MVGGLNSSVSSVGLTVLLTCGVAGLNLLLQRESRDVGDGWVISYR